MDSISSSVAFPDHSIAPRKEVSSRTLTEIVCRTYRAPESLDYDRRRPQAVMESAAKSWLWLSVRRSKKETQDDNKGYCCGRNRLGCGIESPGLCDGSKLRFSGRRCRRGDIIHYSIPLREFGSPDRTHNVSRDERKEVSPGVRN